MIDSVRNRIYLTRLYLNSIYIVDLLSLNVLDSIAVGLNPQGLLIVGSELYVCNSGYGTSRSVSVVDLNADTVKATITAGEGPTSAAVAPDGKIWIACTGISFPPPTTPGSVFIIDPVSRTPVDSILFSENLNGAIGMGRNGYAFVAGATGVYRIHLATKNVTSNYIPGNYYALAVQEASGDILVTDAKTFNVDGDLYVFSDNGVQKRKRIVGKVPGAIAFK
jgi:YVTN family beta-propeller protein